MSSFPRGGPGPKAAAAPNSRPRSAAHTKEALQGYFNLRGSRAPSFSKSTRFACSKVDVFRDTGPGKYTPRDPYERGAGGVSFAVSSRAELWKKKDPVTRAVGLQARIGAPGPGAYSVRPAMYDSSKGVSFGTTSRSTCTFLQLFSGNTSGGKVTEGRRMHDDAIATKSARMGTAVSAPGPGQYHVDVSCFSEHRHRGNSQEYKAASVVCERIPGGVIGHTSKAYMQPGWRRGLGTPGPGAYTPLWGA